MNETNSVIQPVSEEQIFIRTASNLLGAVEVHILTIYSVEKGASGVGARDPGQGSSRKGVRDDAATRSRNDVQNGTG